MDSHHFRTQLAEFARFRDQINTTFVSHILKRFGDGFFAKEIRDRIEKGRKIRSFAFVRTAEALLPSVDQELLLDVSLGIEMCHAASVLVDDILDGDDTRHGFATSHSRLGTSASVLEAHFLCAASLRLVKEHPSILCELIDTYSKLTIAEAYDILLPEPVDCWLFEGYTERVYQKTSALFEYSLASAGRVTNHPNLVNNLKGLGNALGKLYQFSNDFFDLQPHNLPKRHVTTDSWRITFSLPLALYLRRNKLRRVARQLRARVLSYAEWVDFLNTIWTDEVKSDALHELQTAESESRAAIANSPLPIQLKNRFLHLIRLIMQEDFWYHSYAV